MSNKKTLLLFLLIFLSLKCFPAVFVVTSNADSGPGTLRDALAKAAANGSATQDIINFNLPDQSQSGRSITLITALPNVSSNLVIDGTTQPGATFGVSDTKVIIQSGFLNGTQGFNLFNMVNVDGFEIYGMYIRDFNGYTTFLYSTSIFYVEDCKNLQIGAPGKGNVFANVGIILSTALESEHAAKTPPLWGVDNLKFYSNFCGFEPDGKSGRQEGTGDPFADALVDITSCQGDIEIGGDDVADRNIFGNKFRYITQFGPYGLYYYPSTISVKNNYFDYDVNGQPIVGGNPALYMLNSRLVIDITLRFTNDPAPYTVNIINNKMQYPTGVNMPQVTGEVDFKGNVMLREATYTGPDTLARINLSSSAAPVIIGGELPGEANTIEGYQLSLFSPKSMLLHRNQIYCAIGNPVFVTNGTYLLPKISITSITPTGASGTATPNSEVEIFQDDDCPLCQPLTYITTIMADASGNWSYTGTMQRGIIASATLNGFTSYFTTSATLTGYTLVQSSCGVPGSLTGFAFTNSGGYVIKNSAGLPVSTNADATNLAPGQYVLTAQNVSCSTDYPFTILDATPKINDSQMQRNQPSCGQPGSITKLSLDNADVLAAEPNAYKITWFDAGNNPVGSTLDLTAPTGSYTLQVTYIKNNCSATYGPVVLTNPSGIMLDETAMVINDAACGQPIGSITNIKVTGIVGTPIYTWFNSQQLPVGHNLDLTGQPAGVYNLQVTDDSHGCPANIGNLTINDANGITLDETQATTMPTTCGLLNNGSVTGIKASGATTFSWTDTNGNTTTTNTPDLTNAPAGTYTLTASNPVCNKTSATYTIAVTPLLSIVNGSGQITSDQCSSHTGSIKAVQLQGGKTPYTYSWTDANGKTISSAADLINAGAGSYTLTVSDATTCTPASAAYTLQNQDSTIPPPVVNSTQLCSAGQVLLQVKDPLVNYSYRLYTTGTSPTPIDEQASGNFNINAATNSSFFVSQVLGDCESTRTEVHVSVGISATDVANTITPNGDGINDYWQIKNIENYPAALIQIFTRGGQKVFDSKGYGIPFDGTYKGKKLPVGVYYYIINLGTKCSLLSGSLTIIR